MIDWLLPVAGTLPPLFPCVWVVTPVVLAAGGEKGDRKPRSLPLAKDKDLHDVCFDLEHAPPVLPGRRGVGMLPFGTVCQEAASRH